MMYTHPKFSIQSQRFMEHSLESHVKTLLTCTGTGQVLTTVCKHFQSTLVHFHFITTLKDTLLKGSALKHSISDLKRPSLVHTWYMYYLLQVSTTMNVMNFFLLYNRNLFLVIYTHLLYFGPLCVFEDSCTYFCFLSTICQFLVPLHKRYHGEGLASFFPDPTLAWMQPQLSVLVWQPHHTHGPSHQL